MKELPKQLLQSLKNLPGFNETDFVAAHQEEIRITSIRLNPFKKVELDFKLNNAVEWCSNAFYLNERPSFTHDPLFHAGCYYVQEAGSMFLEHALKSTLDLSQNITMLDLCASPGGKSTLINSLISSESLLVCNDVGKPRAEVLAYNLSKWGTSNTVVSNSDPQKFTALTEVFDAIVVDAPCSGSGLFRKQADAIDHWSLENVSLCGSRQKRILGDVIPALKENGLLFYSTCSYSSEENEDIVNWLLKNFDMEYVSIALNPKWGIVESTLGYRFYPHLTKSEGFFIAVLRKKGNSHVTSRRKNTGLPLSKTETEILSEVVEIEKHSFHKNGTQYHLLNHAANEFVTGAGKHLYLKKAGVSIGEIKGKDLVPNHELALSLELKPLNKIALNYENTLRFLKKEPFDTNVKFPKFSLICYQNMGLGWAKILSNRINNYLPNELRILK